MSNVVALRPAAIPAPIATQAIRRLAVLGWSPETRDAVRGLAETGGYEAVAVADPSGTALVQARRDTALPCHQQVRTFLQHGEYDTLLVGHADSADAIRVAADRGAEIVLVGDACDASTLAAASEVCDKAVFILQPILHESGFAHLTEIVTGRGRTPRYLSITVEAPTDPQRLISQAVAQYVALTGAAIASVTADEWDAPARAIHVALQADECHARIDVRHAPAPFMRIVGEGDGGAFEWRSTSEGAMLAQTAIDGSRVAYAPAPTDSWQAEAQRIVTQHDDDHARISRQATLLEAISRAAATGIVQSTACCTGSAHTDSTRAVRPSHLRLVVT